MHQQNRFAQWLLNYRNTNMTLLLNTHHKRAHPPALTNKEQQLRGLRNINRRNGDNLAMGPEDLIYESINPGHQEVIAAFDSGKEHVNVFLSEYSYRLHESGLVKTRLYFSPENVLIGYFSLFCESVTVVKSKREQQGWTDLANEKNLFPAMRLHYLGIQKEYQHSGFGEHLLFEAINVAREMACSCGCVFVTLETEEDCLGFYRDRSFIHLRRNAHDQNFMDMCLRISEYN